MKDSKRPTLSLLFPAIFLGVNLFFMNVSPAEPPEPAPSLSNLAIPKSLGKIEERFTGSSPRWVIHIQDVHAHFAAQENIAAIVEHLNAVYGIKIAALEGGWSRTSYPLSWGLPNSRQKQMLARRLLEEDYITGPAYAALFSQTPILLVGVEDQKLYEENRQIYLKHFEKRNALLESVRKWADGLEGEKARLYSPELLEFDKSLQNFREGKKAEKFLPLLVATAAAKGIDFSDLDQIGVFKGVLEKEQLIHKEKLEGEAARLTAEFKKTGLNFEELLRSGKLAADKLDFYPESQHYFEILKLQDQISHRRFFQQVDEAVERIKEKMMTSENERELDLRFERFLVARKIILFQATPEDLNKYEKFTAGRLPPELIAAGLEDALKPGLDFYEIAERRDQIFFDKITSDPDLLKGNIVFVTGGFHTEGMSEKFEKAGISYMVITPDLASEAPNEELYFKRLSENLRSAQTLSENDERNWEIDDAFSSSVAELIKEGPSANYLDPVGRLESKRRRPAVPETTQTNVESAVNLDGLPPNELEKILEQVLQRLLGRTSPTWETGTKIHGGQKIVTMAIQDRDLLKLFGQFPQLAPDLWRASVSNRSNRDGVVVPPNQTEAEVGTFLDILNIAGLGKSNVFQIQAPDMDAALLKDRRLQEAKSKKTAAILGQLNNVSGIVLLEPNVISLAFYREIVEGRTYIINRSETRALIQEILEKLLIKYNVEQAA